jgi:carbonic anhydrase
MQTPTYTADEALQRLKDGNERFLRGEAKFSTVRKETLADLAKGQHPYATILGCSDSRVPPELIFDADFGELFIVRVAGSVVSAEVMGSLQYAGAHLRTPLFVVLGHEGCGAVKAAVDTMLQGVQHHSRIQILVDSIVPGLQPVNSQLAAEQRLQQAVEQNVRWSIHQLLATPEGKAAVDEGRAKIVGALYEIGSGRVRWLD